MKRRQAENRGSVYFYTLLFMCRKAVKFIFEKGKASGEGGGFRGCLSVVQNIFRGGGEEGNSFEKLLLSFLDAIITHQNRQIKRLEEDFRIVSRKFIITFFCLEISACLL